jgi:hypothetical protein
MKIEELRTGLCFSKSAAVHHVCSSEIHVWLRILMTLRSALVVLDCDCFVADVAELVFALFAVNAVCCPFLLVDVIAVGTYDAKLDVDEWVFLEAQVLLDHFDGDFIWEQ